MQIRKTDNKFKRFFTHFWRIICYVLLDTAMMYFLATVVAIAEMASGATIIGDDPTSADYLLTILLPAVILLMLMWPFLNKEWKREGFWRFDKLSVTGIVTSAGIGLSMSLALNSLFGTLLCIASMDEPVRELMVNTYGSSFLAIITTCFVVPVAEEVLYRGTVLKRLREARVILPLALIIQGVLFGTAHTRELQIIYASATGIAYGLIYLRTGSIWAPIISHAMLNALSKVFVPIYNHGDGAPGIVWFLCFVGSVVIFIVLMRIQRKRFPIPPVTAKAPAGWQCACGFTVTDSICPGCGRPASSEASAAADGIICPACGEPVKLGDQFCKTCGKKQ